MLSRAGYDVDTVRNGAEAVRAATSQQYDAILMDCQMPEMNGYEATAAIRLQEGASRHTPIIAMTAGARGEDRERCLAEGMDEYVSKPVSKGPLLEMVRQWVGAVQDEPRPLSGRYDDVVAVADGAGALAGSELVAAQERERQPGP